jgi:N-hydroxyarylamine O-acetyltransferase
MTLAEQPLQAFESMCRHHQTSPESVFSTGLICTRATETGRITLSRNRLIIIDGERRTETLATNVSAVLNDHFGINHIEKPADPSRPPLEIIASC